MRIAIVAALLLATDTSRRAESLRPGLVGEYYDMGREISDFPDLSRLKPALVRIDPKLAFEATDGEFAGSGLSDCFCVRWTGKIRVPRGGRIRFRLLSDDGSRLVIGGTSVVDNGGLHPPQERDGEIELAEGLHDLRVDFFENRVTAALTLFWAAGKGDFAVIPPEAFLHRRRPDGR